MHRHSDPPSRDDDDLMDAARAMIGLFERALGSAGESVPVADARLLAMASAGYSVTMMARRIGQPECSVRADVERLTDARFLALAEDSPPDRAPVLLDRGRQIITDLRARHRLELEKVLSRLARDQRDELVRAFDVLALIDVVARSETAAESTAPDSGPPTN